MYTKRRDDGHRKVGGFRFDGASEIVISGYYGRTGEDGRVEVVVRREHGSGCGRRRARKVGEVELFGNGMGDVDVWRLSMLQSMLNGLDQASENVLARGDGLIGRAWIGKHLRYNLDCFTAGVREWQRRYYGEKKVSHQEQRFFHSAV